MFVAVFPGAELARKYIFIFWKRRWLWSMRFVDGPRISFCVESEGCDFMSIEIDLLYGCCITSSLELRA